MIEWSIQTVPFVKVDTAIRHSKRLKRVSDRAGFAYFMGLLVAQECADDGFTVGAFESSLGPFTLEELADDLRIERAKMKGVCDELLSVGLWTKREDGCLIVARFEEKTTSSKPSHASRQRAYRARKASQRDANVTSQIVTRDASRDVTKVTRDVVEDRSKNIETPLPSVTARNRRDCVCRDHKLDAAEFTPVEDVVDAFLGQFANCKTDKSRSRHRAPWLGALRDMRAQRFEWPAIWAAFSQAHADGGHAPFHGLSAPWANLRASRSAASGGLRVVPDASKPIGNIAPEDRDGAAFRRLRDEQAEAAKAGA